MMDEATPVTTRASYTKVDQNLGVEDDHENIADTVKSKRRVATKLFSSASASDSPDFKNQCLKSIYFKKNCKNNGNSSDKSNSPIIKKKTGKSPSRSLNKNLFGETKKRKRKKSQDHNLQSDNEKSLPQSPKKSSKLRKKSFLKTPEENSNNFSGFESNENCISDPPLEMPEQIQPKKKSRQRKKRSKSSETNKASTSSKKQPKLTELVNSQTFENKAAVVRVKKYGKHLGNVLSSNADSEDELPDILSGGESLHSNSTTSPSKHKSSVSSCTNLNVSLKECPIQPAPSDGEHSPVLFSGNRNSLSKCKPDTSIVNSPTEVVPASCDENNHTGKAKAVGIPIYFKQTQQKNQKMSPVKLTNNKPSKSVREKSLSPCKSRQKESVKTICKVSQKDENSFQNKSKSDIPIENNKKKPSKRRKLLTKNANTIDKWLHKEESSSNAPTDNTIKSSSPCKSTKQKSTKQATPKKSSSPKIKVSKGRKNSGKKKCKSSDSTSPSTSSGKIDLSPIRDDDLDGKNNDQNCNNEAAIETEDFNYSLDSWGNIIPAHSAKTKPDDTILVDDNSCMDSSQNASQDELMKLIFPDAGPLPPYLEPQYVRDTMNKLRQEYDSEALLDWLPSQLPWLRSVLSGANKSDWHKVYLKGVNATEELDTYRYFGVLAEPQIRTIAKFLQDRLEDDLNHYLQRDCRPTHTYVWRVQIPLVATRLCQHITDLNWDDATSLIFSARLAGATTSNIPRPQCLR